MKAFKHNPHPIDLSDFMYGRQVVTGGWDLRPADYEQEERRLDEKTHQDKHVGSLLTSSVNKLRRSVSERLFSMELGKITF